LAAVGVVAHLVLELAAELVLELAADLAPSAAVKTVRFSQRGRRTIVIGYRIRLPY